MAPSNRWPYISGQRAKIAEMVRFECGMGDTTAVSQLPVPLQTGATEPILHKRKPTDETAAEGEPAPKCPCRWF